MIFWAVLLLITLAWRPLRTVVRLTVRAHRSWSVLRRMPHVPSPGLLGWTECIRDPAHAPFIFSRAANERGGLCAFRTLFCAAVVVTDPALAQQVLVDWDLPKSKLAYKIFNMVGGQLAAGMCVWYALYITDMYKLLQPISCCMLSLAAFSQPACRLPARMVGTLTC